jgi:flagellar hook-associated protein 2
MTMSVDGLISGMDTTALITQLLRAEANPQTLLKQKLTATQNQASAYRTVNTAFAAVRTAADALTAAGLAATRTAKASAEHVTATAGTAAITGSSITFSVLNLARSQESASAQAWSAGEVWSDHQTSERLEFRDSAGTVVEDLAIPPGATLSEVAALINDSDAGVRATVLQRTPGQFELLLASEASGTAGQRDVVAFDAADVEVPGAIVETRAAEDATLDLGAGRLATSSTNTFADLVSGVSVTVSKVDPDPVTVSVDRDADAVATKMQALVDAVGAALKNVKDLTANEPGSKAALKGDTSLRALSGRLLTAVSDAVGGRSPAEVGLELTRDGAITFDKAVFTAALAADPDLVTRMVSGGPATAGPNRVAGDGDDLPAVTGIAQRLSDVARIASDSTTGSIIGLAKGRESVATDLQKRIDNWDLRLARRKQVLTRQFTAMETALSSLRNQSTWLAGQINSLPSAG